MSPGPALRGLCVRVIDGDTLVVRIAGVSRLQVVRVWGVDCPEMRGREWWSAEAKAFTEAFALGRNLRLVVVEVDHFGRLIARVHRSDRRSLGLALLRSGCAYIYPWRRGRLEHSYAVAMTTARVRGLGLWARMTRP